MLICYGIGKQHLLMKNKKNKPTSQIILEFVDEYQNRYGKEFSVLVSINQFVKDIYHQADPVVLGEVGLTRTEIDKLYHNLSIKIYERLTQEERLRMLNC